MMEIETGLDAIRTIVFCNLSHAGSKPTVWVCPDQESYRKSLRKLEAMPHIKVLQGGWSHIARG